MTTNNLAFFQCSLPESYSLTITEDGGTIAGARPRRQIGMSVDTCVWLRQLLAGETEQLDNSPKRLSTLFTLAAKGYVELKAKNWQWEKPPTEVDLPVITVIIPVKDRPEDIKDCLASLQLVKWPKEKLEIIVVDDGSTDHTPEVAASMGATVLRRQTSGGPSAARNLGAQHAKGEILAFLDSDCTVDETWLLELYPWVAAPGIGGVGGFVASYYNTSKLDRYEEAMSSLSMGKRLLYEGPGKGNFYVPTCNLLVKKSVYEEAGGLNPEMHLGEDVDLCWRLRERGYGLLYVTVGRAWHKHRNALGQMLKRRMQYGTSESDLYKRHPDKKKLFPLPATSLAFYLGLLLTLLLLQPWCLSVSAAGLIAAYIRKRRLCQNLNQPVGFGELWGVVCRSALAFCYYLSFHLIRYYLILLFLVGCFFPALLPALLVMAVSCSIVDYRVKKPNLDWFSFTYFYWLEQIYYQAGVFAGCCRRKYFRCYLVKWQATV